MYAIAPLLLLCTWVVLFFLHQNPDVSSRVAAILARTVREGAPLALLAIGAGLVLSTGGVDISTAGVATAAGALFAACTQINAPLPIAVCAALALGAISGMGLGYGVHYHLPGLILSWAIGAIWLVATLVFADSGLVQGTTASIRLGFMLPGDYWAFLNTGFTLEFICVVVAVFGIGTTNLPRRTRAVGANRDSAVYAGIRSKNVYLSAYILSGVLAAGGGVLWALVNNGAQTTDRVGDELIAIAIAILGGTVMTGGYLFLPSVVAAAFFWVALRTAVEGADLLAFPKLQNHVVNGLFALLFVLILLPLGSRLSGPMQTIKVEPRVQEK